jgi:hypothetical protein
MARILQVLALVSLCSSVAAAQSIYVAGAAGADVLLDSGQESIGLAGPSGGGESVSGAARLGTVLNDRFGIELEVSRAAELRESSRPGINPLAAAFPFVFEIDSRTRLTTISTTASIRQQVSDNVALAYLGGVVFHRTDSRVEYGGDFVRATSGLSVVTGSFGSIPPRLDPISPVGLALPFSRSESVRYGAGPVVGFEAHIGVGEHFRIIPGVRMHGLPASWLVRPAVAAGWLF